jgi:phenolic acid decarboxylase
MKSTPDLPPFAGKAFEVRYDELTAINRYNRDGVTMGYEITEGPYRGAKGEVQYAWQRISPGIYAIAWQEADRSTVVHIDDFDNGNSLSYFTTPQLVLHRLIGSLRPI